VDEDESGVDKVEGALRRVVRGDIVLTNFDIPAGKLLGPRHVDVGGEHVTRWPHSRGQPVGNRGPADANFPAVPSGSDAERVEVPERHGIEQCGEAVEALPGLGRAVVEQVAALSGGPRWLGHRSPCLLVGRETSKATRCHDFQTWAATARPAERATDC
jgi:hypothetical protein